MLLRLAPDDLDDPRTPVKVLGHLGSFAFLASEVHRARDLWQRALDRCEDPLYRTFLEHNLSWAWMLTGEWERAASLVGKGILNAEKSGDTWDLIALLSAKARLDAWRGNASTSIDTAWRAVRLAPRLENIGCRIDAKDALGVALLESGEAHHAVQPLTEACTLIEQAIEPREFSFTYATLAEALVRCDALTQADEALAEARRYLPSARFWGIAIDRTQALRFARAGQRARALGVLERFQPGDTTEIPYEHYRCLDLRGRLLYEGGAKAQGNELVREALVGFESIGARARSAKAAGWLESHAQRPRGRPRSDGLTPRERDVIALVAEGLTNREIAESLCLSVGTVKKHVEHLIRKTGASRRTELARIALLRQST